MSEAPAVEAKTPGLMARFRKQRRQYVKQAGKRGIRMLGDFLGRQSRVGNPPVFDPALFPSLKPLEENWREIRAEVDRVLEAREHLPNFQDISPDQKRISKDNCWKTYILYGFKYRSEKNCARCPATTRVLEQIPGLQTAMFSILSPGYHIPAHKGVTKGVIRVHLGLKVPQKRENVRLRVADQIYNWTEGKILVFDDTFEHEVWNDTDEERVVLFLDIERPMRVPGRLINWAFLKGIRWTAYVQEAKKNLDSWENRFEAAVRRADALHINADKR
jgi:aspartyl/asparaginyl beta-hydroxylase (cupin superfamily)